MLGLDRVKLHLKVDGTDEDVLIEGYLAGALSHVEMHCDRKLVEADPIEPEQMGLTADVEQAILLLVGHWYANREAVAVGVSVATVPLAVDRLLWYRKRF